jgi:RecB family exonuclease
VDVIPAGGGEGSATAAGLRPGPGTAPPVADVVEPTLPLLRERVVITDYKSSDVRDPAKARERSRESLQLTIYAMGWQAQTGRLPDSVALYFLESGLVGTSVVDEPRLDAGREAIRRAAAGIRAASFEPTPSWVACSWCAYREICPASVAR